MTLGMDESAGPLGAPSDRHDADRLLAGYRDARTQETLFDLRPGGSKGPGIGFDEFFDQTGYVRPSWPTPSLSAAKPG
jgi:hypothetical protein